jgi:hypothetical protein
MFSSTGLLTINRPHIPDFTKPLGLLAHCHERIEGHLRALERAAEMRVVENEWRRGLSSNPRWPSDHSGFRVRSRPSARLRRGKHGRESKRTAAVKAWPGTARHVATPTLRQAVNRGVGSHRTRRVINHRGSPIRRSRSLYRGSLQSVSKYG